MNAESISRASDWPNKLLHSGRRSQDSMPPFSNPRPAGKALPQGKAPMPMGMMDGKGQMAMPAACQAEERKSSVRWGTQTLTPL